MAFLLWWDSSQKQALAGLLEQGEKNWKVLESRVVCVERKKHSERLLAVLEDLLKNWDLSPRHIDALAVGIGPGSFTGLRVGLAIARAWAFFLKKKLFPLPSCVPWSWWWVHSSFEGSFVVLRQAWRGEVFYVAGEKQKWKEKWQRASFSSKPFQEKGFSQGVMALEKVQKELFSSLPPPVFCVTEGLTQEEKEILKQDLTKEVLFFEKNSPPLEGWSALAALVFQKQKAFSPLSVLPAYWRKSHAELKLEAKELSPSALELPSFLRQNK